MNLTEYWQALAPIAEAFGHEELVLIAEQRLKAIAYEKPVGHFNQSIRLLANQEFRAGWKLNDWRLAPGSPNMLDTEFAEIPMWEGEYTKDRHILVVLENGLGDQIFGLRYVQALIDEGAKVEIAVGESLFSLVQSNFLNLTIHNIEQAKSIKYWSEKQKPDFWTYSFSVASRGNYYQPIFTSGYLKAKLDLVENFQKKINEINKHKIPVYGLVWHGDIRTPSMRSRAYSVTEILQQINVLQKPCVLVALQKDITTEEADELNHACKKANCIFINAASDLTDFANTAAWIQCLDHLYSCDTACAHLAGALAKSATVLVRNTAIWNWAADPNSKSVWYDSVRVQLALVPKHSFMFELPGQV